MSADSYTVAEAARLLGVSPKRVRQMIAAGGLPTVPEESPVRLPAEAVHQERERRKQGPSKPGPAPTAQPLDAQQVLDLAQEIASRVATDSLRLALEAAEPYRQQVEATRDRTEQALRDALAEAEARALAAEGRLTVLREQLAEAEQQIEKLHRAAARTEHQEKPSQRRLWRRKQQ